MSRTEAAGQKERTGGRKPPLPCLNLGPYLRLSVSGAQVGALQPLQSCFPLPCHPLLPRLCPPEGVTQWPEGSAGRFLAGVLFLVAQSCLTLCDPMDCSLPGSSVHGDSPGKNTDVDCHFLLQGIFPTQESNPDLHGRRVLYLLSHQAWESPKREGGQVWRKLRHPTSPTPVSSTRSGWG